MARKNKHKKAPEGFRPKGNFKLQVILSIVATDNTFSLFHCFGDECWLGKCIHCGAKLLVCMTGHTDATIEHIDPICHGGAASDPRNLALACARCNNMKGIHHDLHVGKGGRADEVIAMLQQKRLSRWREPNTQA